MSSIFSMFMSLLATKSYVLIATTRNSPYCPRFVSPNNHLWKSLKCGKMATIGPLFFENGI